MSWIRTAASMISFGFTLYKFFFYLRDAGQIKIPEQVLGPRSYGLIMISIGILALVLATIQNRRAIKALRRQNPSIPVSLATIVAGLIGILGLLALAATIFRV